MPKEKNTNRVPSASQALAFAGPGFTVAGCPRAVCLTVAGRKGTALSASWGNVTFAKRQCKQEKHAFSGSLVSCIRNFIEKYSLVVCVVMQDIIGLETKQQLVPMDYLLRVSFIPLSGELSGTGTLRATSCTSNSAKPLSRFRQCRPELMK